jgi:hypothetical protein
MIRRMPRKEVDQNKCTECKINKIDLLVIRKRGNVIIRLVK